ncbi:hypothetical protein HDU83_006147 [Entophlyctis luteolus]|nr:hypothetical protein HDU83_006147 [Entophlyctis luteolus]
MANIADTLEATALKYSLVSKLFQDILVSELYSKSDDMQREIESLNTKLKSAMSTIVVKSNLAQDLKAKLDAVLAKVGPIQLAATESDSLKDNVKRLSSQLKHKDAQAQEWKRKFQVKFFLHLCYPAQPNLTKTKKRDTKELELVAKESAAAQAAETARSTNMLSATHTRKYRALQTELHAADAKIAVLDAAVCAIFTRAVMLGAAARLGTSDNPTLAIPASAEVKGKMWMLSKEFFGLPLTDVMNASVPSSETLLIQLKKMFGLSY